MSRLKGLLMPWRKPMRDARKELKTAAMLGRLIQRVQEDPDLAAATPEPPVPREKLDVQHDNPFLGKIQTWAGEEWGYRPRRFRLEVNAGHLGTFEHRGWCNPEKGPTWAPWAPVGGHDRPRRRRGTVGRGRHAARAASASGAADSRGDRGADS